MAIIGSGVEGLLPIGKGLIEGQRGQIRHSICTPLSPTTCRRLSKRWSRLGAVNVRFQAPEVSLQVPLCQMLRVSAYKYYLLVIALG